MANIDKIEQINSIDRHATLRYIQELPDQIEASWKDMESFVVPANYIKVTNVVILGMGGSGIGGRLAKAFAIKIAKIPIEVIGEYDLPGYVSSDTLIIAVSYSGGTEETISCLREAGKRKAKIVVITMGGEAASIASNLKVPVYKIEYGSQPRAALGYTFTPVLGVLNKLGIIELGKDDIAETVLLMRSLKTKLNPEVPTYQNEAKKIATTAQNMMPVIIGGEMLAPVAYRWATQIHENGKHAAYALVLPELCHNWLNGLHFPVAVLKQTYILILQSKNDHERNRLRQNIISRILQKNGIKYEFVSVGPVGGPLSEMMLTLYLGDYVSYYLAILNDIDPDVIEDIIFLKKQLG